MTALEDTLKHTFTQWELVSEAQKNIKMRIYFFMWPLPMKEIGQFWSPEMPETVWLFCLFFSLLVRLYVIFSKSRLYKIKSFMSDCTIYMLAKSRLTALTGHFTPSIRVTSTKPKKHLWKGGICRLWIWVNFNMIIIWWEC